MDNKKLAEQTMSKMLPFIAPGTKFEMVLKMFLGQILEV